MSERKETLREQRDRNYPWLTKRDKHIATLVDARLKSPAAADKELQDIFAHSSNKLAERAAALANTGPPDAISVLLHASAEGLKTRGVGFLEDLGALFLAASDTVDVYASYKAQTLRQLDLELINAIRDRKIDAAQDALKAGADPNTGGRNGGENRPIYLAALIPKASVRVAFLKLLVEHGAGYYYDNNTGHHDEDGSYGSSSSKTVSIRGALNQITGYGFDPKRFRTEEPATWDVLWNEKGQWKLPRDPAPLPGRTVNGKYLTVKDYEQDKTLSPAEAYNGFIPGRF